MTGKTLQGKEPQKEQVDVFFLALALKGSGLLAVLCW
jgi:hypothetical protein